MKRYFFPVFLLLLTTQLVLGQALLTADEAVKLVLKNNYDILIAGTATDISKANNTAGNAGMMPGIGLKAGDSYSMYNSTTNLTAGGTATYPDSRTNSFAAAAELSWTLFDGGKMFITKKKLNELEALGELNFRDKVSQTVYNTILAYYDVVRQKQQLSSIREAIHYNEERVKILQASFNAGLVPKTDLLQAQVDLNVYLENAILQETVILDSKRSLNQLLSRDADTPYEVLDSIDLDYHPDRKALNEKLYKQNTQVLSSAKQLDVSKLTTREISAQRYPWLSFSADYNYLQNNYTAGTNSLTRNYGPVLGGSLTLPIYDGHRIHRLVKISKLEQQAASYDLENTRLQANTDLQNALSAYERVLQLLNLEKSNLILAKENLDITMRRLQLGQTTSLEVRQAEESYIQSLTRQILFKYSAKSLETKLRQLVSEL